MSLAMARLTQLVEAQTAAGGGNVTVTPSTAALALTAFIPRIGSGVIPGTLTLTLTAFTPAVTATANVIVTPGTVALALTNYAPRLITTVTPATAALALTAYAPVVSATGNVAVTPSTAALTLTAYEPAVTTTAHVTVTPSTAALTTATFVPRLITTLTPTTAAFILTAYAPTVTATANVTVTPVTAALAFETFVPTVTGAEVVVPPAPAGGPAITPRGRSVLLNPPGVPWQPLRLPQMRALAPDAPAYADAWAAGPAMLAAPGPAKDAAITTPRSRSWAGAAWAEASVRAAPEMGRATVWQRQAAEIAQLRRRVREIEERAVLGLDRLPMRTLR